MITSHQFKWGLLNLIDRHKKLQNDVRTFLRAQQTNFKSLNLLDPHQEWKLLDMQRMAKDWMVMNLMLQKNDAKPIVWSTFSRVYNEGNLTSRSSGVG